MDKIKIKISSFKETGKWNETWEETIFKEEWVDIRRHIVWSYSPMDCVVYWEFEGDWCPMRLIKKEEWS